MLKIFDGRSEFYQWDSDQKLIVTEPTANEVHFCNGIQDCSLVCEVFEVDGQRLVNVPNVLFVNTLPISAYLYDGCCTKHSTVFRVKPRSKPSDYVYTETEVRNWEEIERRLNEIELTENGIGEVEELPTEHISTKAIYRVIGSERLNYYCGGEWLTIATHKDIVELAEKIQNLTDTKQDNLSFDGEYNGKTNKVATVSTITTQVGKEKERAENVESEISKKLSTVESIAKGANQAESYITYGKMVEKLNSLPQNAFDIGQSILIGTINVPDVWISDISTTYSKYNYTTEEELATKIYTAKSVKVGYFILSALETQKVDLTDYAKIDELKAEESRAKLAEQANASSIEAMKTSINLVAEIATDAKDTANSMSDEIINKIKPDLDKLEDSIPTQLSDLKEDEFHRTVTDAEKKLWSNADSALKPADVVNNLISTETNKPLSAYQGKVLDERITEEVREIHNTVNPKLQSLAVDIGKETERATKAEGELSKSIQEMAKQVEENIIPQIVNSDYEENDASKKSYILNRPFYEGTTSYTPDGNTVSVFDYVVEALLLNRFSDTPISKDNLAGISGSGKASVIYGTAGSYEGVIDSDVVFTITEEDVENAVGDDSGICITLGLESLKELPENDIMRGYMYVVYDYETYASSTSIPFTSNGVYLSYYRKDSLYGGTDSMTIEKIDVDVIKKLDNKFVDLPNNEDFVALEQKVETVESIAKGANQAVSFDDYQTMIAALNSLPNDKYIVGQNLMIRTLKVPDLWVSAIEETSVTYTYTDDDTFANEIITNGSVQVGYYVLSALETQKVDLTDYAKTEVLADYVKNTDYATRDKLGLMKPGGGLSSNNGQILIEPATEGWINSRQYYSPITARMVDYATLVGITGKKTTGNVTTYGNQIPLTDDEKTSAKEWLGIVDSNSDYVQDFFITDGSIGLAYNSGTSNDVAIYSCAGIGNATETDIEIASMIRGVKVQRVLPNAFEYSNIRSVKFLGSSIIVQEKAFAYCGQLWGVYLPKSFVIHKDAFDCCSLLSNVYYEGTEEEWNACSIGSGNESLTNATIHYNSSKEEW